MNAEESQEIAEEGTRLFVGGLSSEVDDSKLREAFQQFGRLRDAFVTVDRMSGRSRGFGFVSYHDPEDAQDAIDRMTGKELCGRNIRVSHAVKQVEREPGRGRRGGGGGGRGRGRGRGSGFRRNNKPYSDPRMGRDMDRGRPRGDGSSLDYGYNKYGGGDSERPPYSRESRDSASSYQPDYRNAPTSGGYGSSVPYKDDKYGASHAPSRGGYGASMPYKDDKYSTNQPPSRGGYSQRRGSGGHRGGYRSSMPSGTYSYDDGSAQSQSTGMYPQRSSEGGYPRRDQNSAEVPSAGGGGSGSYRGSWKDSYGNRGDRMGRANAAAPSYQVRSDYNY